MSFKLLSDFGVLAFVQRIRFVSHLLLVFPTLDLKEVEGKVSHQKRVFPCHALSIVASSQHLACFSVVSECPDIDEKCEIGGDVTCPLHSTCQARCLPKFCKVPRYHKKVFMYDEDYQDHFVKIGGRCVSSIGYMHVVMTC